jgi:hypothetical protein
MGLALERHGLRRSGSGWCRLWCRRRIDGLRLRGFSDRHHNSSVAVRDGAEEGANFDRITFLHHNLGQNAGGGRRDLDRYFVRFEFDERFVGGYLFASLLKPLPYPRLYDGLT